MMVWTQKHTQFPGPSRTNDNVVGYPLLPVYMAKAGGFFFIVFGIIALIGGLVTVNPIWIFGPYTPDQVSAGTQPDWYIGWLDGALRLMPNWESVIAGFTISWNVFIPAVIIPGILFTGLALYPFLEAWATGDKREHNLLERPRNAPVRTGIGVAAIVFYGILWIGGGNDVIATAFNLSFNALSWTLRISLIILPPLAFLITKRICLGLQRKDRDKLLHGYESGRVLRLPHGEFVEVHQPLNYKELAVISSKEDMLVLPAPIKMDGDGVRNPKYRIDQLQHKLSSFFLRDNIERPTDAEIEAGQAHAAHLAALESPLNEYELQNEYPAGHGGVLHHPGMPMTNQEQLDQRQ
jgi:ubiquinol-cytochrome c reductase cytochrome b subunit